uniref:RNA-directed DNA polymerase n=1 Tax=Marinomonas sp. (strain MWYL1) TaxID=400668 RepID=A6W1H0_MARMS
MFTLLELREARTTRDLAKLLGYSSKGLTSLTFHHFQPSLKYITFTIPKKNGTERLISAPNEKLKTLQGKLSLLLQDIESELEEYNPKKNKIVHGFKRDRTIITNAKRHIKKKYVLNLDIKDYFGSITFPRIMGFFIKDTNYQLDPHIATRIAQIACHDGSLPQGSPCSPVVSNLIFRLVDMRLLKICQKYHLTYTRYADDLTFSSQRPIDEFLINKIIAQIEQANFEVNKNKTRVYDYNKCQQVTGLTVNEKVSVNKKYYKNVRAMTHSLLKTGRFLIDNKTGSINSLEGMLSFIDQVQLEGKSRFALHGAEFRKLNAKEKLLRDFYFYKKFYSNKMPLVIGEGKTDGIILKTLIYKTCPEDSVFFKDRFDGSYDCKLDFHYWTEKDSRFFGSSGGAAQIIDFIKFIFEYRQKSSRIESCHVEKIRPIILVLDTDGEGIKAINAINAYFLSKKKIDENVGKVKKNEKLIETGKEIESFYKITEDIYIVPISNKIGRDIEDLFPLSLLTRPYKRMKFKKVSSEEKAYDKIVFAEKIVKPLSKESDFALFSPVTEAFKAILSNTL